MFALVISATKKRNISGFKYMHTIALVTDNIQPALSISDATLIGLLMHRQSSKAMPCEM
jgi:hypothetical protein